MPGMPAASNLNENELFHIYISEDLCRASVFKSLILNNFRL